MTTEIARGHNDHAERSAVGGVLGGEEAVEGGSCGESRRMVAAVMVKGALLVDIIVIHCDSGPTAENNLACDGIDTHRTENESCQSAVAGDTFHFDPCSRQSPELIGSVTLGIDDRFGIHKL